jgi:hypothetical protein
VRSGEVDGDCSPDRTVTHVNAGAAYDPWVETFVERELKLEPPVDFVLPPLEGEPLDSRVFTSTYHDTPSRSLAHAGITLRRRVENGLSTWQLKLPREDGRAAARVACVARRAPAP